MPYKRLDRVKGILLGLFGPAGKANEPARPTHVLVVNMDYESAGVTSLIGPGPLESLDAAHGVWQPGSANRVELRLPPGGGQLLRVK
jgi:hypothetical protein